ncbi:endolytic transglycosylase MltG [Mobiluncus mulieris]|uniref:Endolytic murein transglycosylase n=1 Tax=Mobiluncus mulieris TaxID=2052 RepID=A0A7Y0UU01_9ACTO|nr:endolytic transglycosylase MltG [Mobiluncus mulieris]NMX03695.1 endolytic transglycosylase MltG [Mobiluncus mulieris]
MRDAATDENGQTGQHAPLRTHMTRREARALAEAQTRASAAAAVQQSNELAADVTNGFLAQAQNEVGVSPAGIPFAQPPVPVPEPVSDFDYTSGFPRVSSAADSLPAVGASSASYPSEPLATAAAKATPPTAAAAPASPEMPGPAVLPEVEPIRHRRRAQRSRMRRKSSQRRRGIIIITVVLVLIIVGAGGATWYIKRSLDAKGKDYEGQGSGQVEVSVPEGANGTNIAQILEESGVVASTRAFINACTDQEDACKSIQPGTYLMAKHMSAVSALARLVDDANRLDSQITLGPGLTKWQIKDQLVKKGGFSPEDVDAAFAAAPGLPEAADGNVEGWLAPGSYLVMPGQSATEIVGKMVANNIQRLKASGLAPDKWQEFLTKASIVQREGSDLQKQDYAKIARVIENRLDVSKETMGFMNMDSTVLYGLGEKAKERKLPSKTEVADASNPYNTYKHKGLPPSPIGVVGEYAFKGTLKPAAGNWLYFTTVDLNTGETRFSSTHAEQDANVELLKQFCNAHSDLCQG